MTTPDERRRTLVQTGAFLKEMRGNRSLPEEVRQEAHRLLRHYPIAYLAGHEHIAPGRKQDPGPGFDWARLKHLPGLPPQVLP